MLLPVDGAGKAAGVADHARDVASYDEICVTTRHISLQSLDVRQRGIAGFLGRRVAREGLEVEKPGICLARHF